VANPAPKTLQRGSTGPREPARVRRLSGCWSPSTSAQSCGGVRDQLPLAAKLNLWVRHPDRPPAATKAGGTEQSAPATRTSASRATRPRGADQLRAAGSPSGCRNPGRLPRHWRRGAQPAQVARRGDLHLPRVGLGLQVGQVGEGPERQEARLAVSERPLDPVACVRRGRPSTPVPRGSYLNPNRSCLMRLLVVLGERD